MPAAPNVDTYPLVGTTDTLVIVFAEHGVSTVRPQLTLVAGVSDTEAVVRSGPDLEIDLFSLTETIPLPQLGSQAVRPLPITGGATINNVTVVTVNRGKVAVTVTGQLPFRSYLQQPTPNPPLN